MKKKVSVKEVIKCDLVELLGEQEENIEIAAQSLKVLSHPRSLLIPMGNKQALIDKICSYDRVFLHYLFRQRAQTVYTRLSLQGLENLICINNSVVTDWHQASLPIEQ